MRILKVAMIAISVLLLGSFQNKTSAQVSVNVSFQTFYDELSPYGEWIDYPEYGYVWRPDNYRYRDFHPYRSDGRWAWSEEYGWLWVSDYEWGWAPFHYGRWVYDEWDGWLWVPDYEWGPAWVEWRGGDDYYGWAPMRPGIHFSINIGNRYDLPYNYWSFAPRRYINYPRISNYCMGYDRNTYIFNKTTIINNYDRSGNYYTGPSRYEAERYTRIEPVRIRESQRAGRSTFDRNEVSIYRPGISRRSERNAPGNFETYRREQNNNDRQNNGNTRTDRPYDNRGYERNNRSSTDQRTERQQIPDQNNQRQYRPYQDRGNQRTERQTDQRVERQQVPDQTNQRPERQNRNRDNQRTERQQFPSQNDQRIERQQFPGQNQRVERQQFPDQNNPRIERQSVPDQNSQRVERPYQSRGQQQPQVQSQSQEQEANGNSNGNGNGRGRGRGNN